MIGAMAKMTLVDRLEQLCFTFGDETCLYAVGDHEKTEICFSEVVNWAKDVAAQLQNRFGAKRGQVVLICARDGQHTAVQLVAMLASMMVGLMFVPCPVDLFDEDVVENGVEMERFRFVCRDCRPVVAVVVGKNDASPVVRLLNQYADIHRCLLVNEDGSLVYEEALMCIPEPAFSCDDDDDDMIYIMYTSGSTSGPKGVVGTRRGLMNRVQWQLDTFPFGNRYTECCSRRSPQVFVDSLAETLVPFLGGVPILSVTNPRLQTDIITLATLYKQHEVSRIQMIPSQLLLVMDAVPCWDKLKFVFISGESVNKLLVDRFKKWSEGLFCRLVSTYGSTEVSGDVCFVELTNFVFPDQDKLTMPIGHPLPNTELTLSESGEIMVSGHNVAAGYWGSGHCIPFEIIPFPTGDLGTKDGDTLYWLGRKDFQVKVRGTRMELEAAELQLRSALEGNPVGLIIGRDEKLVLFVESNQEKFSAKEIYDKLSGKVLSLYVPHKVQSIVSLPKTKTGKLDRKALMQNYNSQLTDLKLESDQQASLKEIVLLKETLNLTTEVDLTAPFRALGGDSLTAVSMSWKLKGNGNLVPFLLSDRPLESYLTKVNLETEPQEPVLKRMKSSSFPMVPSKDSHVQWTYKMRECVDSRCLVCDNTFLFVGSHGNDFVKLRLCDGSVEWTIELPGSVQSAPIVVGQGRFVVVSSFEKGDSNVTSHLSVLDFQTGQLEKQFLYDSGKLKASPVVDSDLNVVWIGSCNEEASKIIGVNLETMTIYHEFDVDGPILGQILVQDHMLFVGTSSWSVYGFDGKKKQKVWERDDLGPVFGTIQPFLGKFLVFGSVSGIVYCLKQTDGETNTAFYEIGGSIFASLCVQNDEIVVAACNKTVSVLKFTESNGFQRSCEITVDSAVVARPCVLDEACTEAICVTTSGAVLLVNFQNQQVTERFLLPGEIFSDPTQIGLGKREVVFGCRDDHVYYVKFS